MRTIYTNSLYHYGMPRRSGRYKWGSGKKPYQDDGPGYRNKKPTAQQLEKVVQRGNSKEIRENFEYLSDKELARAVTRANFKRQLSNINPNSVKTGRERFNEVMDTTGKTMRVANDAFKLTKNAFEFYADPFGMNKKKK